MAQSGSAAFTATASMGASMGASMRPLVLAGPSGVGKSTFLQRLMRQHPHSFGFSVSHTTRNPREGEKDGVHYHFVSRDKMLADIRDGLFLEHAEVHRNLYGTSFDAIRSILAQGRVCILDIDLAGCSALKTAAPSLGLDPVIVFIKAPSMETLRSRIQGRGDCSEEVIKIRLETAEKEMKFLEENPSFFNAVIVNDDLETAYDKFKEILIQHQIIGEKTEESPAQ
eukprot:TRINITY_DN12559_c0_g1_i1.p1 TRINITY_DN12559_c0_g1~~TRINITY_DN12559_c0_g1_i1.p1  ORF type:complete len:226 (+),score=51.31 TRINITY_DN12559_c0_g1_i1:77-754(+)